MLGAEKLYRYFSQTSKATKRLAEKRHKVRSIVKDGDSLAENFKRYIKKFPRDKNSTIADNLGTSERSIYRLKNKK